MGDYGFVRDTVYSVATEWLDETDAVAALPDAQGYGNVYSLHQAMLRDASLESLVESFVNETDAGVRQTLFNQILYKWAGSKCKVCFNPPRKEKLAA